MRRETVALTKKEILAELKKLGINTPSELHSFLWEYENYALENNFSILSTEGARCKGQGLRRRGQRAQSKEIKRVGDWEIVEGERCKAHGAERAKGKENGIYKAAGARLKGITQSAKPLISTSFLTWQIIIT